MKYELGTEVWLEGMRHSTISINLTRSCWYEVVENVKDSFHVLAFDVNIKQSLRRDIHRKRLDRT